MERLRKRSASAGAAGDAARLRSVQRAIAVTAAARRPCRRRRRPRPPMALPDPEDVVEVAADELRRPRRQEADRDLTAGDRRQAGRRRAPAQNLGRALALVAGPLSREDQSDQERPQHERQDGEQHQHHDRLRGGVRGRPPVGAQAHALVHRDATVQRAGLCPDVVDAPLALEGDRKRGGTGTVSAREGNELRHVVVHVASCRAREPGRRGHELAVGPGGPQERGARPWHPPLGGAGGSQEQRLAGEDVAAQPGLGIHDELLDLAHGVPVRLDRVVA